MMRASAVGNAAAQAVIEYAILIGIVTAAVVGMQVYARRGIQAGVKRAADQFSPFQPDPDGERAQEAGMRYEVGDREGSGKLKPGTVLEQRSGSRSTVSDATQTKPHTTTIALSTGGSVTTTTDHMTTVTGELKDAQGVLMQRKVIVDGEAVDRPVSSVSRLVTHVDE